MTTTLLQNGRVIDPASGTDRILDIAVCAGKIVAISSKIEPENDFETINCDDMIVAPGLIDPHVHLREPGQEHKETIKTGSKAAAAGGFTTVVAMPNTSPAIDTPARVADLLSRAAQTTDCRVFTTAAVTIGRKGTELADIAGMAKSGAVAFTDDGDAVADPEMMRRSLREIAAVNSVMMQHCQDPETTKGAAMHDGVVAVRLGLTGWPAEAEVSIVERDATYAREIGCRYHAQHMSAAGSVDALRNARKDDLGKQLVTGEASPHHLLLTHEACEGFNTAAKMNPPLREARDIQALREAVAEGVITVLATDHAPHTADEKAQSFVQAPFGIVGLEIALPLYIEALIESGAIKWPRLIELLTTEPAKLCGLDSKGLGALTVGGPADITVIDPARTWTINPAAFVGKSCNTPFGGRHVKGQAVRTIVAGQTTWQLNATP